MSSGIQEIEGFKLSLTVCQNISKNRQVARRVLTPLLKQYTPYSPTNTALYFINRDIFYSFILML